MNEAKVIQAARKIHLGFTELEAAFAEGTTDDQRWQKLLTLVEDAGGKVTGKEWRELGRKVGYDTRGLGGFYVGQYATMRREADNTRVLTATGKKHLDTYGRVR